MSPVGAVVAGPAVVAWWSPCGVRCIHISSPVFAEDMGKIVEVMSVGIGANVPIHTSLIDVRELRDGPLYLSEMSRWALSQREKMAEKVRKAAVVYSEFGTAALAAGHHYVARAPYPTAQFGDGLAALAWLDCPHPKQTWEEWEEILRQHQDRIDRKLRQYLSAHLPRATLEHCAETLGLSPRSLQRHLNQSEISFRELMTNMRVARAKELLRTVAKITAVAAAVGFSRPEQLNKLLLMQTGKSALDWRKELSGEPFE